MSLVTNSGAGLASIVKTKWEQYTNVVDWGTFNTQIVAYFTNNGCSPFGAQIFHALDLVISKWTGQLTKSMEKIEGTSLSWSDIKIVTPGSQIDLWLLNQINEYLNTSLWSMADTWLISDYEDPDTSSERTWDRKEAKHLNVPKKQHFNSKPNYRVPKQYFRQRR